MSRSAHSPNPSPGATLAVPPGEVARVTFVGADPAHRGCHKAITQLGRQVVHHDLLTEADLRSLQADPTLAHRRAWQLVLTRMKGKNR